MKELEKLAQYVRVLKEKRAAEKRAFTLAELYGLGLAPATVGGSIAAAAAPEGQEMRHAKLTAGGGLLGSVVGSLPGIFTNKRDLVTGWALGGMAGAGLGNYLARRDDPAALAAQQGGEKRASPSLDGALTSAGIAALPAMYAGLRAGNQAPEGNKLRTGLMTGAGALAGGTLGGGAVGEFGLPGAVALTAGALGGGLLGRHLASRNNPPPAAEPRDLSDLTPEEWQSFYQQRHIADLVARHGAADHPEVDAAVYAAADQYLRGGGGRRVLKEKRAFFPVAAVAAADEAEKRKKKALPAAAPMKKAATQMPLVGMTYDPANAHIQALMQQHGDNWKHELAKARGIPVESIRPIGS